MVEAYHSKECGAGWSGGNSGKPLVDSVTDFHRGYIVAELSAPAGSVTSDPRVYLNLTPDHLDRHGDMDGYAAAKEKIFPTEER